jgi:hypothetical protein
LHFTAVRDQKVPKTPRIAAGGGYSQRVSRVYRRRQIPRPESGCALAHIGFVKSGKEYRLVGRDADLSRGEAAMVRLRPHSDPELLFEHRFPLGWALAGLLAAGTVASAVMMLLAQA